MPRPHGDEFESLVAAELPSLLGAAHLLTGDPGRAEDLVQSALTDAFVARRRVLGADSPEAYLRRILVNAHRRAHRRRRVVELLTPTVPEREDAPATTDVRDDVVAAVASLPRAQRAVVVLRFFEDRTETDVAAILGCSVGTVKSHSARAVAALRRHPAIAASAAYAVKETR